MEGNGRLEVGDVERQLDAAHGCSYALTIIDRSSVTGRIDTCQYEAVTTIPSPDGRALLVTAVEACCSTPGSAPLSREDAELVARLLKAVADPVRLQILSIARCSAGGEVSPGDLQQPLGLSQPTVSHHLRVLVEAGLLVREQRGQSACFTLVPERLALASRALTV